VGKKGGDVATIVTPNGKRELEILKLTTIHDEAAEAEQAHLAESNGAAGETI
jgi:transcription elongation factor GreA